MQIKISENIKRLRHERGITQRQLANEFNVNHQTVSKWENGEHMPDVAMLPLIANFFGVTIDELFYDKKIIHYQYEQLVKEQYIEHLIHHRDDEARKLIEEAYTKDKNNYFFMSKYLRYLASDCNSKNLDELVTLSNRIAAECSDSNVIYDTMSDMVKYYSAIGMRERAIGIAENQPSVWRCSEYLSFHAAQNEQIRDCLATTFYEMLRVLYIMCVRLNDIETPKNIIKSQERFVGLIKSMFPNGHFSEFDSLVCRAYAHCAKACFKLDDKEKCYDYLQKSAKYFERFFTTERHTFEGDIWFKILDFGMFDTDNISVKIYDEIFSDTPEIAEDENFRQIIGGVKKKIDAYHSKK